MASTYLSRTGIGSSNNQKKWTFSGWFKKSSNGSELRLITSSDNSSYDDTIKFKSADKIEVVYNNAIALTTNRLFRDINAFYHILVKVDTDQSTANDRIVLYINGVDERTVGGYQTSNMPNQGTTGYINYAQHYIGVTNPTANSNHFNGIMSHVHFTDGYAYDASAFGETDSTTGEWKIKTSPSVSYGTTGFWILKDGNSVTDSSPNSNTFTVSAGTLTKTEDCPSNVFATANPLTNLNGSATYSEGNLKVTGDAAANAVWQTTLGVSSGKWYWELKNLISDSDMSILFYDQSIISGSHPGYGFVCSTRKKIINGSVTGSAIGSVAQNDIWSVALDLDNGKMFIARNGTYLESGNPSTGANPFIQTSDGLPSEGVFGGHVYNGSVQLNFGNGYFGTTAVSSAGTNASGIGIFEYDVPTGYTALSTKGLNL